MKSGRRPRRADGGPAHLAVFKHVLQFGIISLVPMTLLAGLLVWSLDQQATAQAIEGAKQASREVARAVIVPDLPDGIVDGDSAAIATMDQIVRQRVLNRRTVRVKVRSLDGKILYSDEPRLIGQHFPLDARELDMIMGGAVTARLSNLNEPENRYEAGYGQLLEVYLRIDTPSRGPLLFEDYIRYDTVVNRSRRLLLSVMPSMAGGLVLLELTLLPVAWRLARRVRDGQRERQRLLQRAVDASEAERRRIAADLHDSTVQELSAVSYVLSGAGRQLAAAGNADMAAVVEEAAQMTGNGVRQLRTLLVEIYPPTLQQEGLQPALRDLLSSAGERGLRTKLTMPPSLRLVPEAERLIYRTAQETIRNVVGHAGATTAEMTLEMSGPVATLTVRDDGRGFTPERNGPGKPDRHLGLRLLRDLAREAGGELEVSSAEGRGTVVRLRVPAR
jgi:two-component system, NarL family, sensor kinase